MKKHRIFIYLALTLSITVNIYFVLAVKLYEISMIDQVLARYHIEALLRAYDVDLSYDEIKRRFEMHTSEEIREVASSDVSGLVITDVDADVIAINDTRLLFRDGVYIGSQVKEKTILDPLFNGSPEISGTVTETQ